MKKVHKVSNKFYLKQVVACFLVSCLFFNVPLALAEPTGADVVAGKAGVGQVGNTTTVTMGSASAVINWNSLDTSSSEVLQFIKASGGFAVLNRVIQGGATQFDGSLFGNQGHIFIVNPRGVIFGPTSYVQASRLVASGLDIANQDFMKGHYEFVAADGIGTVTNYGHISAEQVALIGRQVTNAGVISTPGGYVLMAAGDRVFLGQEGSNVVVEVDGVTVPDPTDAAAGLGDVINEGTIEAAGGKVVLAAGDTFSRAIEGLDSLTAAVDGGEGRVGQFGTINTDGIDGDGGSVTLTAADVVALGPESVTTANAGANGDGGEVIVYSPDAALFRDGALVEAKGGAESGSGGFFELSGKEYVEIEGQIDLTAADGRSGEFLIDPLNILIYDGTYGGLDQGSYAGGQWEPAATLNDFSILGIDKLEYYLGLADLTVTTDGAGGGTQDGWVIFDAGRDVHTDVGNDNSLTVNAHDYIGLNSGIDFDGGGGVALNAGTSVIMNAAVDLAAGSFTADAAAGSVLAASTLQAGSIELSAGDNAIGLQDNVTALTGNLVLNSSTAVGAGKTLQAGQDIILAENKSMLGEGTLTLDAGSDIMLGVANPLTPETGSGGNVHANGDLTLGAAESIYAHGTLTTTHVGPDDGLGNIELSASDSTIYLFGDVGADVTDDGDIIINNNAWVADGKTLTAGENVTLEPTKTLTGEGDLAITANTGRIQARDIIMPAATTPADPHTLRLVQNAPLSMEDGEVWVYNRDNTNLVAVSTGGGVTSEAADQWRSVSAAALGDIILNDNDSGSGRNINAGLLRSLSGNVEVTALHDKILALGPIDADTGSVLLTAPDGIELYDNVTSGLSQDYNGDVELKGDVTAESTGGSDITFAGTVDGGHGLVVKTAGVTRFQGEVGGTSPLASLTTDAAGRTEIGAGTINVDGASAKFEDPVLLTDNLTINEAGTGDIEFAGTVDSAVGNNYTLTVNSGAGATIFGGAVGLDALDGLSEDTGLGAVTTNAAGTTQINGGSVTTTLDQTYNDPVTLGDNTTLNGTNVKFDQTLNSEPGYKRSLLVNASAVTTFNGIVGGDVVLLRLETDAAGHTEIGAGSIYLNGASAKFGDPVLLTDNLTITEYGAGDIEFADTVDSAVGNNYTLTVNSGAGATIFGGAVGSDALDGLSEDTGLGAVTTNAAGTAQLWADVTTTGFQTYNDDVDLSGDVVATSNDDENITFGKTVDGAHNLTVNTAGDTYFNADVGSGIPLTTLETDAGGTTYVRGDVTATSGITFGDDVIADGASSPLDQTFDGGAGTLDFDGNLDKTTAGNLTLIGGAGIELGGNVTGTGTFRPEDTITFKNNVTANGSYQRFDAGPGTLNADGSIEKVTAGTLNFAGQTAIFLASDVLGTTGFGTFDTITFEDAVTANGGTQRFDAGPGTLWAQETVTKTGTGDLHLGGDYAVDLDGTVDVQTDGGSLFIEDDFTAAGDLLANKDVTFSGSQVDGGLDGWGDQVVQAENGTLTADGYVRKVTPGDLWLVGGSDDLAVDLKYESSELATFSNPDPAASTCLGNLWIEGVGDVQISGDLTTFGECYWCYDGPRFSAEATVENGDGDYIFMPCRPTGGVAVISNRGKIYTEDGVNDDTLNVSVTGSSNHWAYDELHDRTGLGVDLPYGDGKAAILISSAEDLKIGENAELLAYGQYYDDVDDRAGVGFVDDTPPLPPVIGGIPRNPGDAFDAAVYVASTGGNVDVSSPVTIMSCVETEPPDGIIIETLAFEPYIPFEPELEPKGAMVIDAFDSVTFGPAFEDSLAGDGVLSDVGDRLEVVSRISEWLFQAVGKLPYVGGGGPFVPGYEYVLRGAGLGNPGITDGRAWVLENPLEPAPLYREYGEEALEQALEGGCPVLMQWLAAELGVPEETIQVYVANTFAYSTDINPCEACARLFDAANTLADNARVTALATVVSEYVATPAPPSDEQMALIAAALTNSEV
ncbi:MAG: beta strand repeat-containing protein, partial [Planctomycetota bacterium]